MSPTLRLAAFAPLLAALLFSCSSSKSSGSSTDADGGDGTVLAPAKTVTVGTSIYEQAGPSPVGHTTFELTDAARSRSLRVSAWYPADESARAAATTGMPLQDLEPAGPHHDSLKPLVDTAPATCTRKNVHSAPDGTPAAGASFPVVVFSHCHNCVRFSAAQVAERLASHGFIVVAPDHTGNTLYDHLAGKELPLDATTLELRVGDVRFVLDTVLDPMAAAVPKSLRGRFDATKAGMMGHSFGSVTTGAVLSKDSRFRAGFAIAAPFDFIGDTKLADIKVPTFFLLAREDNSISSIGNALIRNDFKSITATDFMIEVVDAGHFSFSDICGLHSIFTAGCGHARRQTDPSTDLNYLENEGARGLAASYAAAFFRAQLTGDAAGLAFVKDGHPADIAIPGTR